MYLAGSVFLMLFSNDVWAIYGIMGPLETTCPECSSTSTAITNMANATTAVLPTSTLFQSELSTMQTLIPSAYTSGTTNGPRNSTVPSIAPATSSPPAPTAKPTQDLRNGMKIGIGVAVGLLGLVLLVVILEACYLRRKRHERACRRAVDEVERGADKGSEERIVLESRVSIVFHEGPQEEGERGRNGMSLPRRELYELSS